MRNKVYCEVCGELNKKILHRHHIIPQCDKRCSNKDKNIAILCPNCHTKVHEGEIIIIGLYESTDGLKLMWFKKGEEPPLKEEFWLIKENSLVIRRSENGR
jgi:hypothetical protein